MYTCAFVEKRVFGSQLPTPSCHPLALVTPWKAGYHSLHLVLARGLCQMPAPQRVRAGSLHTVLSVAKEVHLQEMTVLPPRHYCLCQPRGGHSPRISASCFHSSPSDSQTTTFAESVIKAELSHPPFLLHALHYIHSIAIGL